jgi:hypothetical protein
MTAPVARRPIAVLWLTGLTLTVLSSCVDWDGARNAYCRDNPACDAGTADAGGTGADAGIPFSQFCPAMRHGLEEMAYVSATSCGEGLLREDMRHLRSFEFISVPILLELSNCEDGGELGKRAQSFSASMDAGRMAYDPYAAAECRDLPIPDASVQLGENEQYFMPEPCSRVFLGRVAIGGACSYHEECEGQTQCVPSGEASCGGTCQARLAVGVPCDPQRTLCAIGSHCGSSDAGYLCAPNSGQGGPCEDDMDCKPGFECDNNVCRGQSPVDGGCQAVGEDSDCADGLFCVDAGMGAGVCRRLALNGEPCGDAWVGQVKCGSCLTCQTALTVPLCIAVAKPGEFCQQDSHCQRLHYCQKAGSAGSGTCAPRPRRTETCAIDAGSPAGAQGNCMWDDDFCRRSGGTAVSGTCFAQPHVGDPCGDRYDHSPHCEDSWCKVPTINPPLGICTEFPKETEPCGINSTELSASCVKGLRCDRYELDGGERNTGTCKQPPGPGLPCTPFGECADNAVCVSNQCVVKKGIGEACTVDDNCLSKMCDRATLRCSVPCNGDFENCSGCKNGTREMAIFLLFGLVAWSARKRKAPIARVE